MSGRLRSAKSFTFMYGKVKNTSFYIIYTNFKVNLTSLLLSYKNTIVNWTLYTNVVWYFSKGIFPNVQFTKRQFPKGQVWPSEAPKAAMGGDPCGQDGLEGRTVRLGRTWEVAAWEIAHLGQSRIKPGQLWIKPGWKLSILQEGERNQSCLHLLNRWIST